MSLKHATSPRDAHVMSSLQSSLMSHKRSVSAGSLRIWTMLLGLGVYCLSSLAALFPIEETRPFHREKVPPLPGLRFCTRTALRQFQTLMVKLGHPICAFNMDLNAVAFNWKKLLVALSLVLLGFFSARSAVFLFPTKGCTTLAERPVCGDEGRCENPLRLPDSRYSCP